MLRHALLLALRPWLWLSGPLVATSLRDDPIDEFQHWFRIAQRCFFLEFPDGMALSTISRDGRPQVRWVLLKEFDHRGFVFYTNRDSQKGEALAYHPHAALGFFWDALQRQIRVTGQVEEVSVDESDRYFASRPRGSQIGAWASLQSRPLVGGSEEFSRRIAEYEARFAHTPVTRPEHWGGYRVVPEVIEFWKARSSRLHDRFEYRRQQDGTWVRQRLYP
jgi:pyridoxamine 5'-phosphate oxidase